MTSWIAWCEQYYEEKSSELLLYGRALGLSHSEAEDVLQETFISLINLTESPHEPAHYCLRTYRNRAYNYRRSFWRRLIREWESSPWFDKDDSQTEKEEAAMRCLEQLPIEQREVIVLKIWHRYTFEEIGPILSLSPNTAAGRYRYGIQKIRNLLQSELDEHENKAFDRVVIAQLETAPPVSGD